MSSRFLSLKQALARIAGDEYDRLSKKEADAAWSWLLAQVRDGAVAVIGTIPGREPAPLHFSRFMTSPDPSLAGNTLTWWDEAAAILGIGNIELPEIQVPTTLKNRDIKGLPGGIDYLDPIRPLKVVVYNVMIDGTTLEAALAAENAESGATLSLEAHTQASGSDNPAVHAVEKAEVKGEESASPPGVHKRGPKPKVDPGKFERECHRVIAENGMPNPELDPGWVQADLERHMMKWHGDAIGYKQNRNLVKRAMESFPAKGTIGNN